jgi:hypothetical protein
MPTKNIKETKVFCCGITNMGSIKYGFKKTETKIDTKAEIRKSFKK